MIRVLVPLGGVIRSEAIQDRFSPHRLSLQDRIEIRLGIERGWSLRRIDAAIGRHASTVCREINANGGRRIERRGKIAGMVMTSQLSP